LDPDLDGVLKNNAKYVFFHSWDPDPSTTGLSIIVSMNTFDSALIKKTYTALLKRKI
jgi:hypothetical protein